MPPCPTAIRGRQRERERERGSSVDEVKMIREKIGRKVE
jgi:hypothetical protein